MSTDGTCDDRMDLSELRTPRSFIQSWHSPKPAGAAERCGTACAARPRSGDVVSGRRSRFAVSENHRSGLCALRGNTKSPTSALIVSTERCVPIPNPIDLIFVTSEHSLAVQLRSIDAREVACGKFADSRRLAAWKCTPGTSRCVEQVEGVQAWRIRRMLPTY